MHLEVVEHVAEWRDCLNGRRTRGERVGLVPTMGALHPGHASLIRRAAAECDVVAVTNYVNPLQFGTAEDLVAYPRDLDNDRRLAATAGAGLMFAPSVDEMWPEPPASTVTVADLTERFEGVWRPGHFQGVATIVTKLLSLSGPCTAYFGEKDYQQLKVVERLVRDLSIPARIVACPTVRETDGLALSSRNAYFTPAEREEAPHLYYALLAGKRAIEDDGVGDPILVEKAVCDSLGQRPMFTIEYAGVVDPETLETPYTITGEVRLLAAARLGRTRLIDNVSATPPEWGGGVQ